MPTHASTVAEWNRYCLRDCEILFEAMAEIIRYIRTNELGNWQPTGAGMAYAVWRHRFMEHRVLVHDDADAITAERVAMHTGRAEAWRHGELKGKTWVELDLRDAYIRIAKECDLPTKLRYHNGPLSNSQYRQLRQKFRVMARVDVSTSQPVVPCRHENRTIWPVGQFTTWLWDPEIDALMESGQSVDIREAYIYTRAPILSKWAEWVMGIAHNVEGNVPGVVSKWAKHCGRALIGRLSLRTPNWDLFGANPMGETGISHVVDVESGETFRQMHIGEQTFQETGRVEGKDSVPQITGYIMSECRVRIWAAMQIVGFENIAHVDTDGMLVSLVGAARLSDKMGAAFFDQWQIKGRFTKVAVYGPRNYRTGDIRKAAGIPKGAIETDVNEFTGERWSSMATDMAHGRTGSVTVTSATWIARIKDPRRDDAPGETGRTVARQMTFSGSSASGASANTTVGL
jgi:hypothetical protein